MQLPPAPNRHLGGNKRSHRKPTTTTTFRSLAGALWLMIILASYLASRAASLSPWQTSVSVSTSVVSSARLHPPVGQIVARSIREDGDVATTIATTTITQATPPPPPPTTTTTTTSATPSISSIATRQEQGSAVISDAKQSAIPLASEGGGKIRDCSRLAPIALDSQQLKLLLERRRQPQPQQQQQHISTWPHRGGAGGVQLLQPRRAGARMLQAAEAAGAINRQPCNVSRAGPHENAAACKEANDELRARQMAPGGGALRRILRGARDLLSGGLASIEQRAGGLLWMGSNLLATLIPLASLVGLPGLRGLAGAQWNHTARPAVAERLISSLSGLANGQQLVAALNGNSGLQGRVEFVMGWLERSVEHLPSFPRLHPQECIKRSICEAHHEPNRYGAIGLTLRLLFPASSTNGSQVEMGDMEYKVINKYRHAAGFGLSRRLEGSAGGAGSTLCKEKYDDCLVSLLEVGQKLLDLFLS